MVLERPVSGAPKKSNKTFFNCWNNCLAKPWDKTIVWTIILQNLSKYNNCLNNCFAKPVKAQQLFGQLFCKSCPGTTIVWTIVLQNLSKNNNCLDNCFAKPAQVQQLFGQLFCKTNLSKYNNCLDNCLAQPVKVQQLFGQLFCKTCPDATADETLACFRLGFGLHALQHCAILSLQHLQTSNGQQ